MKLLLISVFTVIVLKDVQSTMTEAQSKAAIKLLRNVCQPKTKISNEQIDAYHSGTFTQEPEVLSYMECTLRTAQIMKDGKVNTDFLAKQLLNLPVSIGEPATATADHCKDAAKSDDKFVAAYEYYKCYYDDNPSNFFLP